MPYIPHTNRETQDMLSRIGARDIDELFDEIPDSLMLSGLEGVPAGLKESEIDAQMRAWAGRDGQLLNFLGAGAYDHYIPAPVWEITTRGEFYSAYTPYQAEASQGTLQVIYEYQTMMASLTGMEVSNASMYDGATAFAEACLMAVRANRRNKSRRILVSRSMSPVYREVARTLVSGQGIELVDLPLADGCVDAKALKALAEEDFVAIALQQPSFLGTLEAVDELTDAAHRAGALVIAVVNPVSLALLKPPGDWGETGADIACGDGQPLGIPLSGGGPYFGFMVTRRSLVRQMPGRIAGRTVDTEGRPGFTLTLQPREQHIRRSKATSNICTNQGLMVTAATIYMALLGAHGLERVASASYRQTHDLAAKLARLPGVKLVFDSFFHEAVLQLPVPVGQYLDAMSRRGISAGYSLTGEYPELGEAFLLCVTESRTASQIENYLQSASAVLGDLSDQQVLSA